MWIDKYLKRKQSEEKEIELKMSDIKVDTISQEDVDMARILHNNRELSAYKKHYPDPIINSQGQTYSQYIKSQGTNGGLFNNQILSKNNSSLGRMYPNTSSYYDAALVLNNAELSRVIEFMLLSGISIPQDIRSILRLDLVYNIDPIQDFSVKKGSKNKLKI